MRPARAILAAGLVAWAAAAGAAEIAPPEGAVQTALVARDHDTYPLPVAPFGGAAAPTEPVSGPTTWAAYTLAGEALSTAEVAAHYRAQLEAAGFEIVLDCRAEECGGFDFRFGAALLPPPEMRMDVADFVQISARHGRSGEVHSILVTRLRGTVYLQTVRVAGDDLPAEADGEVPADRDPAGADHDAAAGPAARTDASDPEPAAPASPSTGAALALLERLMRDGRVIVAGLDFGSGGAVLSEGSAPALDVMAEMLKDNPDLGVAIVGHSDNVGSLNANIELSRRRADAVRRALVQRGVAAARLEARGVGYLAPLRANTTEEGRALNRRVELVLR